MWNQQMRLWLFLLPAMLVLGGCTGLFIDPVSVPSTWETTQAPESQNTPDAPLLLVTLNQSGLGLEARRVDPLTLADLPGYDPIDLGHHYTYALSPDGETMAVMVAASGSPLDRNATLHLVSLPSWTVEETGITVDDNVHQLIFHQSRRLHEIQSQADNALYWFVATARHPAHGIPRNYILQRYRLVDGEVTTLTHFPESFIPWEMRLLNDGKRLAVYGVPTDPYNVTEDAPHLYLLTLPDGEIAAQIRLDGLAAGQFHLQDAAAETESPYRVYRPALAWDHQRDLLYAIDPLNEQVTLVDLAHDFVVRQEILRRRLSLGERFWRWLWPTAAAKAVPGVWLNATLSPDGNHLYLTGTHREMTREDESSWASKIESLGLRVVDTATLEVVAQMDLPVDSVAVSPQGTHLLLQGAVEEVYDSHQNNHTYNGLYILDAGSLAQIAHLRPDEHYRFYGFTPDAGLAYAGYSTADRIEGAGYGNWRSTLHVLDLTHPEVTVIAERELEGSYSGLIGTP